MGHWFDSSTPRHERSFKPCTTALCRAFCLSLSFRVPGTSMHPPKSRPQYCTACTSPTAHAPSTVKKSTYRSVLTQRANRWELRTARHASAPAQRLSPQRLYLCPTGIWFYRIELFSPYAWLYTIAITYQRRHRDNTPPPDARGRTQRLWCP